jgi:hypothetical protein
MCHPLLEFLLPILVLLCHTTKSSGVAAVTPAYMVRVREHGSRMAAVLGGLRVA